MNKGYFITATGTDVGKTYITALLVKKWRDLGINAGYYKAALSGAEIKNGSLIAGDANFVKNLAHLPDSQEEMVSYIYKEALSPHLAAQKEGPLVELSKIQRDFLDCYNRHDFMFVEGSGGIICPIRYDLNCVNSEKIFLTDIIKLLELPLLIVSTAELGSINACVLTVEYAKSKNIPIRGIIINRFGISKNIEMENDNISMIKEITQLPILAIVSCNANDLGVYFF